MYNFKYKTNFKYKALKKDDMIKIFNIISNIDGLFVEKINTCRKIKTYRNVEFDKNEFLSFDDFIAYLDNDINYLDKICFNLKTDEGEELDLEYDDAFDNWELTYNKSTKTIDSFILHIKKIFKKPALDLYKKIRWIIFYIAYAIEIILVFVCKIRNKYITIYSILVLLIGITNYFLKCKPYINNKYILRNRDNIIFYILGVLTPYIIDFIIELFK